MIKSPGWSARRLLILFLAAVVGGGAIAGFLLGRGERSAEARREAPITPPERVATVGGRTVVTLDAATMRNGGIETALLPETRIRVPVTGYGTVLDLRPLADLASRVVTARADRDIAAARLAASGTAYRRAKGLYHDRQNISAAQFQAAEAALRIDQAGLTAAESRLSTVGMTAIQAWGPILGQAVTDGSPLLAHLLNRQDVLVQVTLPPDRTLAAAPPGATAGGPGGAPVALALVSPAARTDPRIQGASFFYTAPGASGLLPGAAIVVRLPAGPVLKGVDIPSSAVVWWQGQSWIYLQSDSDRFVRRAISGIPAEDGGTLVSGLPVPTRVVVRGAQALLSEEFRAGVQVGD